MSRFDSFSHIIEAGDNEPTQSQLDIFQFLSGKLDEQLKIWAQLKSDELPKVSAMIKQADLPALIITGNKTDESRLIESDDFDEAGAPDPECCASLGLAGYGGRILLQPNQFLSTLYLPGPINNRQRSKIAISSAGMRV